MRSRNICQSCSETTTLIDDIAEWIATSVREAGAKGTALGLSGGVDSAVTAALCARAVGNHSLGLIMPCESPASDERDARLAAEALRMRVVRIPLDKAFRAMLEVLPEASRTVRANLKPRLRMTALYYWANKLSYLVVGTGNRSEFMTGYFTKHGDGGVDLLPLGSIYKGEVRKLAIELGVPDRIIAKPPSAGLWMGQTDEGEMGISYDQLDRTLRAIESGGSDAVSAAMLERVGFMRAGSAHKRRLPVRYEVMQ